MTRQNALEMQTWVEAPVLPTAISENKGYTQSFTYYWPCFESCDAAISITTC